jgi:hypothetical protein
MSKFHPQIFRQGMALRCAGWALVGWFAACGSSQGSPGDVQAGLPAQDAGQDAAADAYDGTATAASDVCHMDCIGGRGCLAGIVSNMKPEAIPCGSRKSCQSIQVYTCKQGCNAYPMVGSGYSDPASFCAEYPKVPGDRCDNDAQCQPVSPPPGATATDATMTCDLGTHACVSSAQPLLPDYLSPCGLAEDTFAESKWNGISGYAEIGTCEAKTCLIAFTNPDDWPRRVHCLAQACTKPCKSGWDCPQGARCKNVTSLGVGVKIGSPAAGGYVCVPVKAGEAGVATRGCKGGI